ncbi:MAG: lysine--tRNA ligase [Candidatus Aenigmarchaeota archaeon]|nr:lysine--tRNA ligase [Candidatus Aenigmarchaeota archaeon]
METKDSLFWADQLADEVIERANREKKMVSIRSGQTPSGGKHIGNLNDPVRAYFVYKSAIEKGVKARFVNTSDDRDPLKDVPARIADLDGNWFSSDKFPELKKHLGKPLVRVPDPFGCCKSYADHFAKMWSTGLYLLGIKPEEHTNDGWYKEGKFDPYIKKVFEKIKLSGELCNKYQESKSKDYIPFDAICPNCGVLANISGFDLKSKKVQFTCGGKSIKKKKSEGCGFTGEVPWSEGKLQWRFEWPAQWGICETNFEPFGKDHYEGSWKSGQEIARSVFEFEPPIPFVYEFFLVNGQKMSASKGNVYIVQDMLKIIEPEAFLYFYTKRPGRQRDLDLKNIHLLIEDFEKIERLYFGAEKIENEKEADSLKRSYFMSQHSIPKTIPTRIPYSFASLISQYYTDNKKILGLLQDLNMLKNDHTKHDESTSIKRIELARNWVNTYAAPEAKIVLKESISDEVRQQLSENQMGALKELDSSLNTEMKEEELHNMFWKISEKNGLSAPEFFKAIYLVLLGKERGPKLAPFILTVGQGKIADILKKLDSSEIKVKNKIDVRFEDAGNSGLIVGHLVIEGLENKKNRNSPLEREVSILEKEIKENSNRFLQSATIKAYQGFIDSTKSIIQSKDVGPKILVDIILKSGHLPKISRIVDCMNIVSVRTGLTFSTWDKDKIKGDIVYKHSKGGEKYWPFGGGEEVKLLPAELAGFDDEKVLCLVRYRDSKYAPVTLDTKNIVIHIQGVNGIPKNEIESALNQIEKLILETVGGKVVEKSIYQN